MHPDGTDLTQITHTPRWVEDTADWSPDGQRPVYGRSGGAVFCEQVDTINPDGTDRVRVSAGCSAPAPVWSPDGRRLLTNAVLGGLGGL